jgi:hypothetical protein
MKKAAPEEDPEAAEADHKVQLMDDHHQEYDGSADRGSRRLAELRRHHAERVSSILLGDVSLVIGRAYAAFGGRHMHKSRRALLTAARHYMAGGLGRRADIAWRLARLIHQAEARNA